MRLVSISRPLLCLRFLSYSTGRKWFQLSYGQWMVISFVWVLETNTGATVRLNICKKKKEA
jgi:hypothetical protein